MTDKKQKKQSLPQESYQTIDVSMADNEVNNDAMLLDNAVDTELLRSENMLSTELLSPDSSHDSPDNVVDISPQIEDRQINNKVKVEIPDKLYVPELLERYKIKRASLYKHMEYLNISPWKEGNRAYLNAEQIGHMDGLSDHMENNKMETYPKPEPTGPKEKSISPSDDYAPTEDDAQASSAIVLPETSAFQSRSQQESEPESEPDTITVEFYKSEVEEAKKSAQNRVRAKRLAIVQIARTYEENPEMLPPEVLQEIEEAEMAVLSKPLSRRPYYDPNVLVQLAMQSL